MNIQEGKTGRFTFLNLLFGLSLLMAALTGCEDDDETTPIPIADSVAYVSLYHVSPDAPPLGILVDNNRINFNPLEYTEHTGYLRFFTGERDLLFTPFDASNTLAQTSVELENDSLYSIFVTGTEDDLEAWMTEDDIPEPEEGNAVVRVVHVSPDAPAVDLSLTDEENPLFTNIAYRNASDFTEIPAGSTSFDILASGEDDVIASVSSVNLLPGRVYTILVRGYDNPPIGNNNSLSIQIVPNFFNF